MRFPSRKTYYRSIFILIIIIDQMMMVRFEKLLDWKSKLSFMLACFSCCSQDQHFATSTKTEKNIHKSYLVYWIYIYNSFYMFHFVFYANKKNTLNNFLSVFIEILLWCLGIWLDRGGIVVWMPIGWTNFSVLFDKLECLHQSQRFVYRSSNRQIVDCLLTNNTL